jgi:hypothetical protein
MLAVFIFLLDLHSCLNCRLSWSCVLTSLSWLSYLSNIPDHPKLSEILTFLIVPKPSPLQFNKYATLEKKHMMLIWSVRKSNQKIKIKTVYMSTVTDVLLIACYIGRKFHFCIFYLSDRQQHVSFCATWIFWERNNITMAGWQTCYHIW